MFELKLFAKAKTKKFASEKDRKQYYAIQGYYKKKNETSRKPSSKRKSNKEIK